MSALLLAALKWDPQIRGGLILLVAVLVFGGSVYLLLATNVGARVGLVLAVAGLSGWMGVMGVLWMVFGIGLKGREPEWKVKEVITGEVAQSTIDAMADFPIDWKRLRPGDAELADAQAAADKVLAPSSAPPPAHGEEGGGEEEEEQFESPFSRSEDYVLLTGFETGGEDYFPGGFEHSRGILHRPHYVAIQVKPSLFPGGAPAGLKPQADFGAATTTVVLIRDLGSLRFPPFMVALSSFIIFGVCCWTLHQRDKEIMRARAEAQARS